MALSKEEAEKLKAAGGSIKDAKIEKLSLKTKEGSELKNIQISGEGSVEQGKVIGAV